MSDYDPFEIVPSQHPDDQEAVQRREMLEAIEKVQNFLEKTDYVNSKLLSNTGNVLKHRVNSQSLVNALDEIYHYIQENDTDLVHGI